MNEFKQNLYTIRELNKVSKDEKLSKSFQSYSCIYNLIRAGKIPVTKAGNRYLLRIYDIEQSLLSNSAPVVNRIRRIN